MEFWNAYLSFGAGLAVLLIIYGVYCVFSRLGEPGEISVRRVQGAMLIAVGLLNFGPYPMPHVTIILGALVWLVPMPMRQSIVWAIGTYLDRLEAQSEATGVPVATLIRQAAHHPRLQSEKHQS